MSHLKTTVKLKKQKQSLLDSYFAASGITDVSYTSTNGGEESPTERKTGENDKTHDTGN